MPNRAPHHGLLHGLGITKVGSTWYGFGEDKTGETSPGQAGRR